MDLFYTDIFELPLPKKHRFPMSKYRLLRERIVSQGIAVDRNCPDTGNPHHLLQLPDAATDQQLALAHQAQYVIRATQGNLTAKEITRIGFPWTPELIERSRRSTGATLCAARTARRDGCGVNLAGGTHHAFSDCGEGYCVFNDTCVAARVLQQEAIISTAIIIDCDVHQGNGTAQILRDDDSIFSFSIHNQKNFPFRKVSSDLDIGLQDGVGDLEYLDKLAAGLKIALSRCHPDHAFYLAGADPFVGDQLGRLGLSKEGLKQRDELVLQTFRENNIPVTVAMAGGYAEKVADIVDIHLATVETAIHLFPGPTPPSKPARLPSQAS